MSSGSNWAAYYETRKLVTGCCVLLGNLLITWKTKKKPTISQSFAAMANVVCEHG